MRDDTDGGESSLAIGLTRINDIMPNREKLFTFQIVCDFHFKFKHDMTNSFDILLPMPYDNNKILKNNQTDSLLHLFSYSQTIDFVLFSSVVVFGLHGFWYELFRNPNSNIHT